MREKSILARNIQRLRKARGWTQDELADASGISMPAIRAYENDLREPNCKALVALERVFQVTGAQLYGLEPMEHQGAAQAQEEAPQAAHIAVTIDNGSPEGDYTGLLVICQDCGDMIYSGVHAPSIGTSITFQHICSKHRKAVG